MFLLMRYHISWRILLSVAFSWVFRYLLRWFMFSYAWHPVIFKFFKQYNYRNEILVFYSFGGDKTLYILDRERAAIIISYSGGTLRVNWSVVITSRIIEICSQKGQCTVNLNILVTYLVYIMSILVEFENMT